MPRDERTDAIQRGPGCTGLRTGCECACRADAAAVKPTSLLEMRKQRRHTCGEAPAEAPCATCSRYWNAEPAAAATRASASRAAANSAASSSAAASSAGNPRPDAVALLRHSLPSSPCGRQCRRQSPAACSCQMHTRRTSPSSELDSHRTTECVQACKCGAAGLRRRNSTNYQLSPRGLMPHQKRG